ncbi:unnamed protein product [Effrenium voratum]|nr:unnamed protein product [Effrenium voratum]
MLGISQARPWCHVASCCLLWILASGTRAPLVSRERLPLRVEGRFIVDQLGERVKWACVNWYGPESITFTFGGLEKRNVKEIVERIVQLGFNCARVAYSLEAHVRNPLLQDQFILANRLLTGKRFLDGFDAGIEALSNAGIMVIIDQHVSRAGYCCHWSQDEGLWYVPGYPEEVWIDSLVNITRRYRDNPYVVGIDLRNEVHDLHSNPKWGGFMMTWGDENPKTDWAAAATRAGNRVLSENKDILIVVMALCFGMELRPMRDHPISLDLPNRVIYQTHNYIEYQFWNLIPRDLGISFGTLRLGAVFSGLVLGGIIYFLTSSWRRCGAPLPPRHLLLMSLGAWAMFFCLLFALVAFVTYKAACIYCKWGASQDFLPWVYFWLIASLCSFALLAVSWHQSGMPGSVADLQVERYVMRSEDSCDEETDICRSTGQGRTMIPAWNRGLMMRLQCFLPSVVLLVICAMTLLAGIAADSYWFYERWLDKQWGFALEEGQPFTAPIWMGEFGYLNHGKFWLMFMRYLSSRDVDFAYWAINGIKYAEGFNAADGVYHPLPGGPRWVVELYGILGPDWQTVKKAWMVRDLQALMQSPSTWLPTDIGCITDFLGHFCDEPFRGHAD